jgi:hypothetical protein
MKTMLTMAEDSASIWRILEPIIEETYALPRELSRDEAWPTGAQIITTCSWPTTVSLSPIGMRMPPAPILALLRRSKPSVFPIPALTALFH